jgi:hypothetical protein
MVSGWDALANDHLEPAGLAVLRVARVDVAPVNTDGEWLVRDGQAIPLVLTAVDKAGLLVAEFIFQLLSNLVQLAHHRRAADV